MTPQKAWTLIAQMGWAIDPDYTHIAKKFYASLGMVDMKKLETFMAKRVADLYEAVEKYEENHESLELGSDDGMSDILHHVVGCGQAEFERCLAEPQLMAERYRAGNYKESFAYCFHLPDPPRTQADKEHAETTLAIAMKTVLEQHQKVGDEMDKLNIVIADLHKAYNVVQMDKKTI